MSANCPSGYQLSSVAPTDSTSSSRELPNLIVKLSWREASSHALCNIRCVPKDEPSSDFGSFRQKRKLRLIGPINSPLACDLIELCGELAALVGVDHLDEGDAAAELGFEVGVVRAVLGGEAVLAGGVDNGSEAADFAAADARALVDDDSGDTHCGVALEDARFGLVDGEAFALSDVADSGEQVAGFVGVFGNVGCQSVGAGGGE